MVISYRVRNGRVEKRIVPRDAPRLRGEPPPDRHFSETLLKAYYQLECEHGSRFRSRFPKSVIKKVHDTAIQRKEQTGAEI
jgi:hypothetical protein